MKRVFIADDDPAVCAVVDYWLEEVADFALVGVAYDYEAMLAALPVVRPDIVLVDTMSGVREPLRVEDVRGAAPGARIVVYSGHPPEVAATFIDGQADVYLTKGTEPSHLLEVLRDG